MKKRYYIPGSDEVIEFSTDSIANAEAFYNLADQLQAQQSISPSDCLLSYHGLKLLSLDFMTHLLTLLGYEEMEESE